MSFFEQELKKLFANSTTLSDTRFAGRVCLARLTDTTTVKLEFVTLGMHEKYEGIKATLFNRSEGQIDSLVFRFSDILGKKTIPGNPNFKDGLHPHVWKHNDKYDWYAYKPTPGDFEQMSDVVDRYLEVFGEPIQSQGLSQQMQ